MTLRIVAGDRAELQALRQPLRADGFAGLDVGFDDLPEYLAVAFAKFLYHRQNVRGPSGGRAASM